MKLPCCGYEVKDGEIGPVHANPGNGVVQCHNCGAVYAQPAADLMRAIKSVPTFNMNGYDEDDVRRLHDWAVSVVYLADPPAPPPFVAQPAQPAPHEILDAMNALMEYAGIIEERGDSIATDKARSVIAKLNASIDARQEQPLTNHERIELYELRHAAEDK